MNRNELIKASVQAVVATRHARINAGRVMPGGDVEVEEAAVVIDVVAEQIAQAIEDERRQLGDGALAGVYEHASAIARSFKEASDD